MVTRSMVEVSTVKKRKHSAVVTPDHAEAQEERCSCSIWGFNMTLNAEPVTKLEQNYMRFLCIRRKLPDSYSRTPLKLWSRVKGWYRIQDYHKQLLIALHIALKWDSQDLSDSLTNVRCAQMDWPGLTKNALLTHELQMCKALDWRFR